MPKKGKKPEIIGNYPELARLVLSITGDVTRTTAANHAGVSHDTIARLWKGQRVTESLLIRFAAGYKVDPDQLLKAAGYSPLGDKKSFTLKTGSSVMEPITREPVSDFLTEEEAEDEAALLERMKDPDVKELVYYYSRVPREYRPLVKENVRNAGDIVREMQEGRTIGKRSDRDDNPAKEPDEDRDWSGSDGS